MIFNHEVTSGSSNEKKTNYLVCIKNGDCTKDCYRTFRSEDIFDRKDQGIMGKNGTAINLLQVTCITNVNRLDKNSVICLNIH